MYRLHGWKVAALVAGALLVGTAARVAAQATPIDRKTADSHVNTALKNTINYGADLYNSGDWNGCYRLYEGALMLAKPFLDHRPDLIKAIDEGMAKAKANPALDRRAFDLRGVIDKIRTETGGKAPPPPPPPVAKLWDRLGGEANVKKVIDDFVAASAADKEVDFFRGGKIKSDADSVAKLKKALLDFFSSATGGPYEYKGKNMVEAHKGMGITAAQFDKMAGHLVAALKKNGAKQEDIDIVVKAVGGTKSDIVAPPPPPPPEKTLWERLGGETNVKKVVDDFVAAAAGDKEVDFFRGNKFQLDAAGVSKLKKLLVEFVSDATGGPYKYKGRSMKESHKGMEITTAQFDKLAGHLVAALKKNGAKQEDIDLVVKAVNGTRADIVEKK